MTERDRRNVSDRIGTTMTDQTNWLWLAKVAGAVGGSAISLAYILPHGRREAASRLRSGWSAAGVRRHGGVEDRFE